MGRYNMMPATNRALDAAGASVLMPPKYIKREVVKGTLAPVGRFRGPAPMRTNASTLRLFGPGLSTFTGWQVGPVLHCDGLRSRQRAAALCVCAARRCHPLPTGRLAPSVQNPSASNIINLGKRLAAVTILCLDALDVKTG